MSKNLKEIDNLIKNLKNLDKKDLLKLTKLIRDLIYNVVMENGGHLSSNLGINELIIAIYYVFNMSKTKLIFDIGHQAYTHKILSKRLHLFPKLRKPGGLSGFINSSESEADFFESGHSGVSLPFLYGLTKDKISYLPIAILGDGSFQTGMSMSMLNNLANIKTPSLVIINNNKMNITKSTGKIYDILNNKDKALSFFNNLDLKMKYQENGNDLFSLINDLKEIKNDLKGPLIYIINTTKNYGYEKDMGKFHTISQPKSKNPTWGEIVSAELLKYHNKAYIVQSGMTLGTNMQICEKKYQKRYIEMQMNEEASVLVAKGLLENNNKVIIPYYSVFMQRAFDTLINDIARCNFKPLILITRAGFISNDCSSHQGLYSYLMQSEMNGLYALSPLTKNELKDMISYYFNNDKFISINYQNEEVYDIDISYKKFNLDWDMINKGDDVLVISYGQILLENYEIIKKGNPTIINARVQNKIDENLMDSLIKYYKKILIFEECPYMGSLSARFLEYLNRKNYKGIVKTLYITKKVLPFNSRENLLKENNLDSNSIKKILDKLLKK